MMTVLLVVNFAMAAAIFWQQTQIRDLREELHAVKSGATYRQAEQALEEMTHRYRGVRETLHQERREHAARLAECDCHGGNGSQPPLHAVRGDGS